MTNIEYAHLALVEDDTALADLTKTFLETEGYRVTVFQDGPSAIAGIPEAKVDCILLDIMLPGCDGIEVCRQVRPKFAGPIIFLTAKGDPFDEVMGLEVGGDDYLSKPVEPRVMLAHVRAQLRRSQQSTSPKAVSSKPVIKLQTNAETAFYKQENLNLNQSEFQLLSLLLDKRGGPVSRDEVTLAVRGIEHDGLSRMVDILVSDLRKKLPDAEWIKTIRGKGYIWQGPME